MTWDFLEELGVDVSAIATDEQLWAEAWGLPEPLPLEEGSPAPQVAPLSRKARFRRQVSEKERADHLRRVYAMSLQDYDLLLEAQEGACALCRRVFEERLLVDHDHACCPGNRSCGSCVRGLLCRSCNTRLGFFEGNHRETVAYLTARFRILGG